MFTLRQFSLNLLLLGAALTLAQAQTPTAGSSQAQTARTSIIIDRQAVRFITQGEAVELRLVVTNQQGEVVLDSGFFHGTALDWPLQNQQGEAVASGLYSYALSTKAATEEKARTQRGHVILDRPSSADRIWVTGDKGASIGAESPDVKLSVVGSGEVTVGGAELAVPAPRRDRTGEGQASEGRRKPTTRTVSEEKQQGTSAVTDSPNRLAKFAADGTTLIDSTVTESATGDIGIGTTAPGASLDVRGTRLRLQTDTGNNGPYILLTHAREASGHTYAIGSSGGANGPLAGSFEIYDSTAARSRLVINPSGNVSIGTTLGSFPTKLYVVGEIDGVRGETANAGGYGVIGINTAGGYAGAFSGSVQVYGTLQVFGNVCANNIPCSSDARLKQHVTNLNYGLHHLLQLRPVSWQWTDPTRHQLTLGLIAQEVEGVIPELILREADPAKPLGLNYLGLVPVVIKAIQEQQVTLTSLKDENAALKTRLTALEQMMQEVKGMRERAQQRPQQQKQSTGEW